ncbi:glycoside hydrolase family 26 protein [Streptomyces sulphureus]|uniref:glycoside hydrolase family 26 protein n=1 Tax=Streptomyces sulphureus TaxID=47758 RepID=UPI0003A940BD|nr:glycosyl hydrolase [Streptomyces sulphureus]
MARRRAGAGRVWCGVAAAGALLAFCCLPPSDQPGPGEPRTEQASPDSGPTGDSVPALGAFLEPDAEGVRRIADLEDWLGGVEVRVGHTYLPGDLWSNIEGREDFLKPWVEWKRADPDRMFVLNVPMQERNEEHLSDAEVRGLLRAGADGRFDAHYRALAERLVRLGAPDTVIVLGWEMNGTTYTHRCGPDPQAWKAYWRRIVTAMRSVSGQGFRFDFAPSRGRDAVGWTRCYPGDDFVDIVGMDSYDQPAGHSVDAQVEEDFGLQKQVDFAAAHGKPVSYPEWGLFRNGDNPAYVRRMLAWFAEHEPVYQTVTDYCPHGVWLCRENPESSAVYRAAVSAYRNAADGSEPSDRERPSGAHWYTAASRSTHLRPAFRAVER